MGSVPSVYERAAPSTGREVVWVSALRQQRFRVNTATALASLALLLASVAADTARTPAASESAAPPPGETPAVLTGNVLTLSLEQAARAGDLASLALVVNGGNPLLPLDFAEDEERDEVRLRYLEGAGARDVADFAESDLPLRVATPLDRLPGPRFAAATVVVGDVAYVLGGAMWHGSTQREEWSPLDAIVRVDLVTGETWTSPARLPTPRGFATAFWDARSTTACPEGCAYLMGGASDWRTEWGDIIRYDPTREQVTTLPATLPSNSDYVSIWTGEAAFVAGGGQPRIYRFDPVEETVTALVGSPQTVLVAAAAFFDPRPTPLCPSGCGYIVGGMPNPEPGTPTGRPASLGSETILRLDPVTGTVVPAGPRIEQGVSGAAVAWDGESAYIVGGASCDAIVVSGDCALRERIARFQPATGTVTEMQVTVPERPHRASAVWWRDSVVVIGGDRGNPADFGVLGGLESLVRIPT